MEPSSGSRFRMSEGDWICSDPQYDFVYILYIDVARYQYTLFYKDFM